MAGFDAKGAAAAGYSPAEIADYLGAQNKFDVAGARSHGYSDQEIIDHLTGAPAKPTAPPDTTEHTFLGDLGHNALGALQIAGSTIGNIPGGIVNAAADFGARATGHTAGAHPIPMIPVGQAGRDFADQSAQLVEQGLDKVGAGDAVARGVGATDTAAHNFAENHPGLTNGLAAAGDALAVIPAAAAARSGVQGITTAIRTAAENAGGDWRAAGFRNATGPGSTTGKVLAGESAKPTLVNHNAAVGNQLGASEANIATGELPSYESLAKGREAPGAVYDRVGAGLPSGQLDGEAAQAVQGAGGDLTNEATKNQLANIKANVTGAKDGPGLVNQLRSMRQEGFTRAASEDVDQQQLGKAQLEIANAIEGHIGRNLPVNGDVSLEQFQAARKALAKNYTWQSALRGNDFDLNAIARMQRADPQLLDGATKTAADFANSNREVVGLPTKLNAPGIINDLKNVNPLKLGNLGSLATAGTGPALGRRLLTGGGGTLESTRRMFSPRNGNFGPLAPRDLPGPGGGPLHMGPEPEPGLSLAPEGAPPAAGGRGGDIPLADLLSHGVEQPPSPGLSAGPMGAPAPQGIPFNVNAEHAAGGLELAPHGEPSLGDLLADLRDHAAVMSQGVPEGTVARSAGNAAPASKMPVAHSPAMITNNASGESAASQEAINRGTRDLVQVDPDGNETPVLRDVTQIDRSAPKGHLIVDRNSGEIVSRGGMNKQGAEGLRNRWASRQRLGDSFVTVP